MENLCKAGGKLEEELNVKFDNQLREIKINRRYDKLILTLGLVTLGYSILIRWIG